MTSERDKTTAGSRPPSGFLSELWTHRQKVEPMGRIELVSYFVRRGLETLLDLPMSSLLTTVTIAAVLFLLSGMMLVFKNVDVFLANAGGGRQLTVYIKNGANEAEVTRLNAEIRKHRAVEDTVYVTKAEALELFEDHLGPHSDLLRGLEKDNPLPSSIDVFFRTDGPDIGEATIEHMMMRLRRNSLVEDIVYGSEWAERVKSLLQVTRVFSAMSLTISLVIAVFIISTTIQLVIFVWRDEISIMRLVGAADAYIRMPFLLGGLTQGFIGSLLGLMMLKLVFVAVSAELSTTEFFGLVLPSPSFLGMVSIGLVLFVGSCTGLLGSSLALRRYMHV